MSHAKTAKLIERPVGKTLIELTGPMLVAVITLVGFNLVDTYFIGQLGTLELAAISFTFPVILIIASLSQGLGIGASAVISRAIGEGDEYRVKRLATHTLIFAVTVVAIIGSIGFFTIEPLFTLLGATEEVMPFIKQYMRIWYIALIVVVIPMVGNATIRATGDTKTPAAIMLTAAGINIILDPILIFGWGPIPGLGVTGGALATALSRMVTMVLALWVLIKREEMIAMEIPTLPQMIESWKSVLYVALPAAGVNMLTPISTGIITGLVAVYGPTAVAAFGVASRVEVFGLAVVMALSASLTPFIGQNWGAGELDRVRLSVRYSELFVVGWGVFLAAMLWLFATPIGRIFNDDPEVIRVLTLYLTVVPFSYALQAILQIVAASLNALNRPLDAAVLSALRLFAVYVPLAIVGSNLFGLAGIFGAAAAANVAIGVAAFIWLRHVLRDTLTTSPGSAEISPAR